MKRIVTMQDISCIGKCSLTVALPIISAMGIETAILPTAVLSTHTMFKGFTFHDLTNELEPIISHWKKEEFTFSAIYTGYLGSMEQIAIAKHFIDTTEGNPLVIVDPCMADAGKLYTGFTLEFVEEMKRLCEKADIICPNITEACLLLHQPYKESFSEEEIKKMLKKLCKFGSQKAIITGVSLQENSIGAYGYDADNDAYLSTLDEKQRTNLMSEEQQYINLLNEKYGESKEGWQVIYRQDTTSGTWIPSFYKKEDLTKDSTVYSSTGSSQSFIPSYTVGTAIETDEVKGANARLEQDSSGRYINITLLEEDGTSVTYALTTNTTTDQAAYNDAMNQYNYNKAKYDKSVENINSKIEIIQAEDRSLELRLKQLDTEQDAIQTEMDAVQKVIEKNTESTFKTFG